MPAPKPLRRRAAARYRRALEEELRLTMARLRANDSQFQLAEDPCYIEQVVYEHAALMCRCNAILRELRGGEVPCLPA